MIKESREALPTSTVEEVEASLENLELVNFLSKLSLDNKKIN